MGRTILYILIGISVIGALAVMLLISPMANQPSTTSESTSTPEVTSAPTGVQDTTTSASTTSQPEEPASEMTQTPSETAPAASPATTAPAQVGYAIDGTIVSGEYAHDTTVAGVHIYWSNDATTLRVGMVSPGTGFVAVGFDPDRQMEGANIIIGAMHEGVLTIRDDYGFEPYAHMDDTARGGTDDIIDAAGNEWPDQTVIEFMIPLDSGDPMDKPLLPGHSYTILAAYHSLSDNFTSQHTSRGTGTIQLDPAP